MAQTSISLPSSTPWVPRSFAHFAKGRVPRTAAAKLRRTIPKRNLPPSFIHSHRPGFVQKIAAITAPPPLLRCAGRTSLHGIPMHIPKLLHGGWSRLLISPPSPTEWVPRSFAFLAKGRVPRTPTAAKLRRPIPDRNLRPSFIHSHRPGFVQKIEAIAAPPPLLRCRDQASLHWIAMHIPEMRGQTGLAPYSLAPAPSS
jgi:hypothetical protein